MPLTIVVDLDDTISNFIPEWLKVYNDKYGDDLTLDRVTYWEIDKLVKPECGNKIYELLQTKGLYLRPTIKPGAAEVIAKWKEAGHRIILATYGVGSLNIAHQKLQWLAKNLPMIGGQDIFFGRNKSILRADVYIDDSPAELLGFSKLPNVDIIVPLYEYNKEAVKTLKMYKLVTSQDINKSFILSAQPYTRPDLWDCFGKIVEEIPDPEKPDDDSGD